MRAAEACAATMAALLPPEMVIRVLNPIIKTGDFPVNQVKLELKQLLFSNLYLLGCHQNVDESCWEANNRQYGDTRGGGDAGIVEGKFYKLETKWINIFISPRRMTTLRAVWGRPPCSASWPSTSWWARPTSSPTWTASMDQRWNSCPSTSSELRLNLMQVTTFEIP